MKTETQYHPIAATYTTDCFRKIKDAETGVVGTKRWQEDRQVVVSIMVAEGRPFYRGAAL
jgi:hypothetical protein